MRCRTLSFAVLAVVLLFPLAASAQTSSTIAGVARDTTGAVLPGVTVEAASPALIEQVRTAVTDGQGVYRIVDLRLGVYSVTFTLPGFSTYVREEIELPAGFTVTINAELAVGTVEETITVTGASPIVDVQNTTQHQELNRDLMDALPSGRQLANYVVTIPGVTATRQDVGGSSLDNAATNVMGIHGNDSQEMPLLIEGMRHANIRHTGGGSAGPYLVNNLIVQEISVATSGATADNEVSGVIANVILKQGGNDFSGSFSGSFLNDHLVTNNIDDRLRALGAPNPNVLKKYWDVGAGVGGPIKPDKLWFYGAYRYYGLTQQPPGAFFAKDPEAVIFEPDLTRTPFYHARNRHGSARLTWQTTSNSRLSLHGDDSQRCLCDFGLSSTRSWEASSIFTDPMNQVFQGTWNWTVNNKLLVEVGETFKPDEYIFTPQEGIPENRSAVIDSGTGFTSRAPTFGAHQRSNQWNGKAVVTYVTGSHNLRVGAQWFHGTHRDEISLNNDSYLNLRNGVPIGVTQRTTPLRDHENLNLTLGIFAQEQWTINRLTANLGVRFDHNKIGIPEQNFGPGRFVGPRNFAAIPNVTNWKDISPRLGVSYDLFGDGRTAIKWNLGRFIEARGVSFSNPVNPMKAPEVTTTGRAWNDSVGPGAGNFIPDCDLTNFEANGECGEITNKNFANVGTPAVRFDPGAVRGWGTRGYNWETMAGIQHQLGEGVSVEVSYHRRWFGNFRVNVNEAVTPADFDPYCVTTPVDSRLPGGGGQELCGLFDISPASGKFGVSDTFITAAENFGDISQVFNGVDVALNVRLPRGVLVQGGMSTGRTHYNFCDVAIGHPEILAVSPFVDDFGRARMQLSQQPRTEAFCDFKPPLMTQTQVKFAAVYPLPWGMQTSSVFQTIRYPVAGSNRLLPGIQANRSVPVAEIVPSLGRPLAGDLPTATVNLVPLGTLYGDRLYQLDLRIARDFIVEGGIRIQPWLDFYNLLNENSILTYNTTYGSRWQQPQLLLQGRMVKFGVEVNF